MPWSEEGVGWRIPSCYIWLYLNIFTFLICKIDYIIIVIFTDNISSKNIWIRNHNYLLLSKSICLFSLNFHICADVDINVRKTKRHGRWPTESCPTVIAQQAPAWTVLTQHRALETWLLPVAGASTSTRRPHPLLASVPLHLLCENSEDT
jgi:hypothetical protein